MGRKAYTARALLKPKAVLSPTPVAHVHEASAKPQIEWLTLEEMAHRLRICKRVFGDIVRHGKVKVPRRVYSRKLVRFDPVAVEAALKVFDKGVVQ
ncbi:MAG: hypothetical protein LV481_12130 [Methylacidiphilales bacterium]|nr:hypothetical protein [Candidatus Methylacidiphilales bacterium]